MQNGFLDTKDFSRAATFVVTLFCVSGGGGGYNPLLVGISPFLCVCKITPNSEVIK